MSISGPWASTISVEGIVLGSRNVFLYREWLHLFFFFSRLKETKNWGDRFPVSAVSQNVRAGRWVAAWRGVTAQTQFWGGFA